MRKWGVSTPAPVRHLVKIRQLSVTIRHLHRMMSLGNNSYGWLWHQLIRDHFLTQTKPYLPIDRSDFLLQ